MKKRRIKKYVLVLCVVFFFGYEVITWPDVRAVAKQNPKTTAFIERYKQRQIRKGKEPSISWKWAPYSKISRNFKVAVLVSEDINFFSHYGVDFEAVQFALQKAWEDKELPHGASTLTQQLAKNLWLSPSYNPFRKFKEAILTAELEYFLPKRRILELYMNVVEFGPGIYGVDAASRRYFGHSAASLTDEEAASLAASLPKPSKWHPGSGSREYQKRVRHVMYRMNRAWFSSRGM
jgi:monofunctional glycosyltransferase